MRRITAPTVLWDLPEEVYHADRLCPEPSLSSTMAKMIVGDAGPARVRQMSAEPVRKAAWDFGSAVHERVLNRGQAVIGIDGDRRTRAVKEAVEEAEAAGFMVLKPAEVEVIDRMTDALLANPLAAELLTAGAGRPEVSMFAPDEQTGRWLRGRLDFLHSRECVVDFKTTAATSGREFAQQAVRLGYHIQAAHYLPLAVLLDLVDPDAEYLIVAQEKTAPYEVQVRRVPPELLAIGAAQVRKAIDLFDRCLTLDDWPGYAPVVVDIPTPAWLTEGEDLP